MQMTFIQENSYVTIKDGIQAEVLGYIGSDLWKLKYRYNNNTYVMAFNTSQIDFNGQDVEVLKVKKKVDHL